MSDEDMSSTTDALDVEIHGWYDLPTRASDSVTADVDALSVRLPKKWADIAPGLAIDLGEIARERVALRQELKGYVYFLHAPEVARVKIGKAMSLSDRARSIGGMSPCRLELLGHLVGYTRTERELHRLFADERLHGEWFRYSDRIRDFITEHNGRPVITMPDTAAMARVRRVAALFAELYGEERDR